jgi:hypothetical protein
MNLVIESSNLIPYLLPIRYSPCDDPFVFDADENMLSDFKIQENIKLFYKFAKNHSSIQFKVMFHTGMSLTQQESDLVHLFFKSGTVPNNVLFGPTISWFLTKTRRACFT